MSKERLRNFELEYMDIGESNSLRYFLDNAMWSKLSEHDKNELSKAIYTYAKSKYIPFHLQFLTIYSILDRFAGNKHGKDPYSVMQQGLSNYGIDIRKIGKSSDPTIKRLRLFLERENNKEKEVTNFCDLRNYILHFMSTVEIDDYLDHAELVNNMKFAVVVILLKKLGFSKCGFMKDWKHLSIMEQIPQQK